MEPEILETDINRSSWEWELERRENEDNMKKKILRKKNCREKQCINVSLWTVFWGIKRFTAMFVDGKKDMYENKNKGWIGNRQIKFCGMKKQKTKEK